MTLKWPNDRKDDGPKTQKFVTKPEPTLAEVPGIGPKAREKLTANGIDLAQLIEAEQASTRVEFIYRVTGWGISPRWAAVVQDALARYI